MKTKTKLTTKTKPMRYFSGGGVPQQGMNKEGAIGGQTILNGLINPMSLLAGVGLPLLSGLMNQNTSPQVIGASPGRYQTGGPIKGKVSKDESGEDMYDVDLPGFTVIANKYNKGRNTKKDKRKLATLGILKQMTDNNRGTERPANVYPIWKFSNKPDIRAFQPDSFYDKIIGRPHYSANIFFKDGDNTAISAGLGKNAPFGARYLKLWEDKIKEQDTEKVLPKDLKGKDLYNEVVSNPKYENVFDNVVANFSDEEIAKIGAYEDKLFNKLAKKNAVSALNYDADILISELSHGYQEATGRHLAGRYVKDLLKSASFKDPDKDRYNTEGMLEHEAHSVIEPNLKVIGKQDPAYAIKLYKKSGKPYMIGDELFKKNPLLKEYQYGGNMQDANILSGGTGFQVKGNPQQTDGNYYPQYNAMLDHNEVVMEMEDGTYVFSDSLTPKGGTESYAKMAAKHLKAIKASEKLLQTRPSDEQSKSTVQKSYAILETIKANQEALAYSKGLRNPDGTPKQSTIQYAKNGGRMKCKYGGMIKKYAAGGPLPGLNSPDQVFAFQQWYNQNNPTSPIKVDGIAGPTTTNLYKQNMEKFAIAGVDALNPNNKAFDTPDATTDRLMQVDKTTSTDLTKGKIGSDPMNLIGRFGINQETGERIALKNMPTDPYTEQPITFDMETAAFNENVARNPITNTGQGDAIFNSEGTDTTSATQRYQTPFTFGDALKVGELVGKFSETLRPAEVEMGNYDSTRITQQSYDPRASIYQADRNFANARNSLDVRNQGQRNATLNSFLANTTNATNNILNQYQGMNNQALSQYEQSVANQQRYNNQERGRVQTANSMNRAALDSARQNVFTSVGQFGEDLNRKKYAADQVNLMSVLFPKGFGAYMNLLK